jgi:hypothetical protein
VVHVLAGIFQLIIAARPAQDNGRDGTAPRSSVKSIGKAMHNLCGEQKDAESAAREAGWSWAVLQRLIPAAKQSSLLTHIATMESVSLCVRMKS